MGKVQSKTAEMKKKNSKEIWYECPECHTEYHVNVEAEIEEETGRLIPFCRICKVKLIRRVKVVEKE